MSYPKVLKGAMQNNCETARELKMFNDGYVKVDLPKELVSPIRNSWLIDICVRVDRVGSSFWILKEQKEELEKIIKRDKGFYYLTPLTAVKPRKKADGFSSIYVN